MQSQMTFGPASRILVDVQTWIDTFWGGRRFAVPDRGKNEYKKGLPRSRWIKRLGERDQLVEWFRPVAVPDWMSAESFAALPATLRVRELQYTGAPWLSRSTDHPRQYARRLASLHQAASGRGLWPEVDDRKLPRLLQAENGD
jgi:hypothetical protein